MNILAPTFATIEEKIAYRCEIDQVVINAHVIQFLNQLTDLIDDEELPQSFAVLRQVSTKFYIQHIITALARDIIECGDRVY